MTRLAAEELRKRYGRREVVNGVSLHVDAGEVVGLLGPNGAGKTTCFYMLVGLIGADGGNITLAGNVVTDQPMHVRARQGLSYLAQEPSIFRRLSVTDNILAVLELRADTDSAQRSTLCEQLLREFGLHHLKDEQAISLSGGERRRLEIARALSMQPRILLLDEPFAGVDPISVVDLQHLIKAMAEQGIGTLITDHNVRETLAICDRAYIINEGAVLAQGNPDEIMANADVRNVYLGAQFQL